MTLRIRQLVRGRGDATRRWLVATVVVGLASALQAQPVQRAPQAPQTHWEQYKHLDVPPQPDRHLTDPALVGAIDLHVHHDPDSYPRAVDAFEVAKAAQERGLRGIVLKNHWTETGGLAYLVRKYATPGLEVFGAVTLDTAVGGLNPQAVRYLADVAGGLRPDRLDADSRFRARGPLQQGESPVRARVAATARSCRRRIR